jgi:hypothetical protein
MEPSALVDGARRLWWKRMTDFWQLEFHYGRGDFPCDELFTADEALSHYVLARIWHAKTDQQPLTPHSKKARVPDLGLGSGAGDENRTRALSLGSDDAWAVP